LAGHPPPHRHQSGAVHPAAIVHREKIAVPVPEIERHRQWQRFEGDRPALRIEPGIGDVGARKTLCRP
jgi:hypothetical protein